MTRKEKLLQSLIITLAVLLLMFAVTWFSLAPTATSAAAAPTLTPAPVVMPTPNTQHWLLENDGDVAYLLTQPGCNLIEQELGEDSRVFTLECDPVKDGE